MISRRQDLASLVPTASTHAGLWLEKGILDLEGGGTAKQELFDALLPMARVPADYRRFFQRWRTAVERLEPHTRVGEATLAGRMVVGLGAESILETSITLHRTYGVPYIPGSALKGLAAAAAHKALEGSSWRKTQEDGAPGESHRLLFGDTASSGYVTFHDALWVPEGEGLPLDIDVMTVHHPQYYQGQGAAPADWDNPVPVAFLTSHGRFLLAATGPQEWVDAAWEILQGALEEEGIGAKTAAGYGRMKMSASAELQGFNWAPTVSGLHMGNAASEVPRIFSRVQGEERRRAALAIIEKLGRQALRAKRDKDWVQTIFKAAEP
jgi:CRISPR-associated protein Cmr6